MPDQRVQGGCQCGAVRYSVDLAEALTLYRCHCRDCQKQSSSAFGMSMILPETAFEITEGRASTWSRTADSGRPVHGFLCGTCGTRLYHTSPSRPGMVNLKPGTLDDPSGLQPIGDVWTDSRQAWVDLLPEGLHYARQPADMEALMARYRPRIPAPEGGDGGGGDAGS
ncbi:GFA family protein [Pelagibius marinus]|uniref:GFA family protein n=1 Tax=Pelagibius marinus TaxID=2762760 RepID=UPI001872E6C3|nr:GFA family protein [Pelagibius marinus]